MWGTRLALAEGIEPDRVVKVLGAVLQVLAALRVLQPVVVAVTGLFTKLLPNKKAIRTLLPMRVSLTKNSKLRSAAYEATDSVITLLQHQVGGYMFWQNLPTHGQHNKKALRKRLTDILLTSFFPTSFLEILVQSALTKDGRPVQPLYNWLVEYVYSNNTTQLYSDWLSISKD